MAVQGIGSVGSAAPPTRESSAGNSGGSPPSVAPPPSAPQKEGADAHPRPEELHPAPQLPTPAGLRFAVDSETGRTIVSLINPETGEVIRQVPSEEALAAAKAIGKLEGAFIDLKV